MLSSSVGVRPYSAVPVPISARMHYRCTNALNSEVRGVSEIECSFMSFSLHLCYHVDVQNSGPISWKSSRQGGVTLSSSEAKFVATSQAGQEFVCLRALLRGLGCPEAGATSIWEIMLAL